MKKKEPNLMVDEKAIGRICDYALLAGSEKVLEIGAGTGNLTEELAERSGYVHAIEKDAGLCRILQRRLSGAGNVSITCGDALKTGFPEYDKVVSNLPYAISRKITEKILCNRFDLAVLVYQKEFAEKLTARPGSPGYRFISALAQSCAEMEILEILPPDVFDPKPPVNSSIVRMRQRFIPEGRYVEFLHLLFDHRNKRIGKLLGGAVAGDLCDLRGFELPAYKLRELYPGFI
ncbi:MAG: ribosomal RNA small subunit methyltransferase A [Candidatus Altiarchaeota archaeon]|nr:ribosomal RNA small subunit methyltransferase A [Candidatus Altiarchaeota archaeon]